MKQINFPKLTLKSLLFYLLVLFVDVLNAQSSNSHDELSKQNDMDTISKLYKNPYNDVYLFLSRINGFGEYEIKFNFKRKVKSCSLKSINSLNVADSVSYKGIYDRNGFLKESYGKAYISKRDFNPQGKKNFVFSTIKSKSNITYILPEAFLFPRKARIADLEDFNENEIDIENFLLKFPNRILNEGILKFDQNENLIYYRSYFVKNDTINKTITLTHDASNKTNNSKVLDYNFKQLNQSYGENIYNYFYNEKGDVIKISTSTKDGTILTEYFCSYEYKKDGKIAKVINSMILFYMYEGDKIVKVDDSKNSNTQISTIDFFYNNDGVLAKVIKKNKKFDYSTLYEFEYYE